MASGNTLALFFPNDNEPPSSNYATPNLRNGRPVLEFDTTTQEAAIFTGVMPQNYAGGNLTVIVNFMAASATSGTLGWDATFERCADGGDDMDSDSFATAQTITAENVPATSGVIGSASVTTTAGSAGTDSIAAGDTFRLRIRRDVSNDNAAGDGQLVSVEIREA